MFQSHIGTYNYLTNTLTKIFSFDKVANIIQASISSDGKLLSFVTKTQKKTKEDQEFFIYKPFVAKLNGEEQIITDLKIERKLQIMVQFLYKKQSVLSDKQPEKLLVMIHEESKSIYFLYLLIKTIFFSGVFLYQLNGVSENFSSESFASEILVRIFMWAQWDSIEQTLYYIHYKKPMKCLVEGEENENFSNLKVIPTLSALQFHDDLPHETVVYIEFIPKIIM